MSKNEFVTLVPRIHSEGIATSSHSDHTKDTAGLVHGHDARHWYNAYMALYEMYHRDTESLQSDLEQALTLLESMNVSAAEMESEIKRLKKEKKKQSKKTASTEESEQQDDESYFRHGVGLSIDAGGHPKLYDLSDPDSTTPKKKISGVRLEVEPGRGFAIRVKKG